MLSHQVYRPVQTSCIAPGRRTCPHIGALSIDRLRFPATFPVNGSRYASSCGSLNDIVLLEALRTRPSRHKSATLTGDTDEMTENVGSSSLPGPFAEADAMRSLVDFSGLLLLRLSLRGTVRYASAALIAALEADRGTVIGSHVLDWIPAESQAEFRSSWSELPNNLNNTWLISLPNARSHRRIRILWTARMVGLSDATFEIHACGRVISKDHVLPLRALPNPGNRTPDQTHRLYAETTILGEDIAQMVQILSRGEEMNHSGSFVGDLATGECVFSDGSFRLAGLPLPEVGESRHISIETWFHPDDMSWLSEKIRSICNSPSEFDVTVRSIRRDGAIRYLHVTGRSYRRTSTELTPSRVDGVLRDITEDLIPIRALRTLERGILALVDAVDESVMLQKVCVTITEEGAYRHASYRSGLNLAVTASSGDSRWIEAEIHKQASHVLESGRKIILPEDFSDMSQPAAVFIPVWVEGEIDGVLAVWSEEASAFTGTAAWHLGTLAVQIGEKMSGLRRRARAQRLLLNQEQGF